MMHSDTSMKYTNIEFLVILESTNIAPWWRLVYAECTPETPISCR
jgi:hypothetical protein